MRSQAGGAVGAEAWYQELFFQSHRKHHNHSRQGSDPLHIRVMFEAFKEVRAWPGLVYSPGWGICLVWVGPGPWCVYEASCSLG